MEVLACPAGGLFQSVQIPRHQEITRTYKMPKMPKTMDPILPIHFMLAYWAIVVSTSWRFRQVPETIIDMVFEPSVLDKCSWTLGVSVQITGFFFRGSWESGQQRCWACSVWLCSGETLYSVKLAMLRGRGDATMEVKPSFRI